MINGYQIRSTTILYSVMKPSNQKYHLEYSSSVLWNSSTFSYETE